MPRRLAVLPSSSSSSSLLSQVLAEREPCSRRAGKLPQNDLGAAFGGAELVGPPGWQPLLQLRPRCSPPQGREGGFSQLLHAAGEGLFARGMGGNQIPCTAAGGTERRGRPPRRAGRGGGGGPPPARCWGAGPRHLPTATSVGCFLADSPPNPRLPSNKSPRHRRGVCRCLVCLYWGSLNPELAGSGPRVPVDLGKGWSRRAPSCHPAAPCPGKAVGGLRPGQGWGGLEPKRIRLLPPGPSRHSRAAPAGQRLCFKQSFFFSGEPAQARTFPSPPREPQPFPCLPGSTHSWMRVTRGRDGVGVGGGVWLSDHPSAAAGGRAQRGFTPLWGGQATHPARPGWVMRNATVTAKVPTGAGSGFALTREVN